MVTAEWNTETKLRTTGIYYKTCQDLALLKWNGKKLFGGDVRVTIYAPP